MMEAEAAIGRERISSCLSTNSFLGFIDWVHSPEVQAYPKEKKKNPIEVIKKKKKPHKVNNYLTLPSVSRERVWS